VSASRAAPPDRPQRTGVSGLAPGGRAPLGGRDAGVPGAAVTEVFDVLAVVQQGRLTHEAVLFAASFRAANPDFAGRLILAEPQPGPLWPDDPRIADAEARDLLTGRHGAEIRPFEARVFGAAYPHGNKIEGLSVLDPGRPFVFFDTDTLFVGPLSAVPFDFDRPGASLRREGTWPVPALYGPDRAAIWRALYDRFGLDFEASRDLRHPADDWRRYLYFNAGFFFHRDPAAFGTRFLEIARTIRDDPPPEVAGQPLDPWLDQIALPLAIHGFGGGRDVLPPGLIDGAVSCHWRALPLLYARESDAVVATLEGIALRQPEKRVLKGWQAARKLIFQGRGAEIRAMFDRDFLPRKEQVIRNRIKAAGLWWR
jgi:hypothetical protein